MKSLMLGSCYYIIIYYCSDEHSAYFTQLNILSSMHVPTSVKKNLLGIKCLLTYFTVYL